MSQGSRRLLLADLKVASLLIYPSRQRTAADRVARDAIWTGIKQAKPEHLRRVGERLAGLAADHEARQLVPSSAVLVPVPRSTPLAHGAVWPALQIAEALRVAGVGALVLPGLIRTEPVRRSTGARTIAEREPPIRHYETISPIVTYIQSQEPRTHYVLVDDVVTTGSTLIACASHIAALVPDATVTAFAVARAERDQSLAEASEMFSPVAQAISLTRDDGRPRRA